MRRVISVLSLVAVGLALSAASALAQPAVSVFPSPGSQWALPGTQIVFRGIPAGQIGAIQAIGSKSGPHSGRIAADSDGQGGSFLPSTPFTPGESVTVTTSLNVIGGRSGAFTFTVATPFGTINPMPIQNVPAGSNGLQHFYSRPDLLPASITVNESAAPASAGDIFVAPQFGPAQDGPMILDSTGKLVWFYPVPQNQLVTDFRVQNLFGQPVLTWWQGFTNNGSGRGFGVIFNTSYQQIATVQAANGLQGMDLHEFLLTPQGQAYIVAVSPVHYPGLARPLMDSVVQEIDIRTGLELFEWDALDHVPVSESFFKTNAPGYVYDPYHLNSVSIDLDGNLIVSMRNTWAVYKIDRQTGAVIWTLGSNRDSFNRGAGVTTAFQHSAIVQPDGTLTIFDDGGGPPQVHSQARAIRVALNTSTMTATLVNQYMHAPALATNFEGNVQLLSGGEAFVGWGQQPYFTEFNAAGQEDFDARFTAPTDSYRAYRFPWSAEAPGAPFAAVTRGPNGVSTVYASWNGATNVASWNVLAGGTPASLAPLTLAGRSGFETGVPLPSEAPYFAVQAIGSSGQVLATSPVTGSTATRLSIFGRSAFVSPTGVGGLPVGCFSLQRCHISATVTAGRTVIARTGREWIGAGGGGTVLFALSSAGRSMLAHARGRQLAVTASITSTDGATSSAGLALVPFTTSGRTPRYAASAAPGLQVYSHAGFLSGRGVGGVFAGCTATVACHATTTVTAGGTVIARTGAEYIGAGDCANLIFSLTSAGRALLARAAGNQLAVQVAVSDGVTTTVQIPLVRFG
jgi:hypothetical protein